MICKTIFTFEMSRRVAQEIATVGIAPCITYRPVGYTFKMRGQRFIVTGHATIEEFFKALEASGLNDVYKAAMRDRATFEGRHFLRISTD